jgi:HK97 family phage portal protein
MALFTRRDRQRSRTRSQDGPWNWPTQQFTGLFSSWSGNYQEVDPTVGETARQSVAIGASIDLITSLVSELPIDVFSGDGAERRQRAEPGYLSDIAGDGYGTEDWISQVLVSWLMRGNAFGDILSRGPSGYPTQIALFHPDAVSGWIDEHGEPKWSVYGQPVTNPKDFWHTRVNAIPNRITGLSMISAHAATIGLNLTGTQFGLQWFKDGAHPGGILSNSEQEMDKKASNGVRDRFMAAMRGNREPAILGRGWAYQPIQIAPEESQFLETQRFTAAECARIFGPGMAEILGYETGGSLTYVTVEGKSVHLSVYTLNKWIRRIERQLSSMLPRPQYAKLNRKALLETTTLDRFAAHQVALANRWTTVNEVRAVEDMAPVAWGDQPNDPASEPKLPIKIKQPTVD